MFPIIIVAAVALGPPAAKPTPTPEDLNRQIDDLMSQMPTEQQVAAQGRQVRLLQLRGMLGMIESSQQMLEHTANNDAPELRTLKSFRQKTIRDETAKLKAFQPEIDRDPSLLKHAKLMNAEEERLIKEARAKGEEYLASEKGRQEIVRRLQEYGKRFDKPDPPTAKPAEPAKR